MAWASRPPAQLGVGVLGFPAVKRTRHCLPQLPGPGKDVTQALEKF